MCQVTKQSYCPISIFEYIGSDIQLNTTILYLSEIITIGRVTSVIKSTVFLLYQENLNKTASLSNDISVPISKVLVRSHFKFSFPM